MKIVARLPAIMALNATRATMRQFARCTHSKAGMLASPMPPRSADIAYPAWASENPSCVTMEPTSTGASSRIALPNAPRQTIITMLARLSTSTAADSGSIPMRFFMRWRPRHKPKFNQHWKSNMVAYMIAYYPEELDPETWIYN